MDNKLREDKVKNKRNTDLKLESGEYKSTDPLISFLYELMRSHITPGQVETILNNVLIEQNNIKNHGCEHIVYTNGFLAKYAPPSENDTERYIRSLASSLGVDSNTTLKSIIGQ